MTDLLVPHPGVEAPAPAQAPAPAPAPAERRRLTSLDVLRGLTVAWMIVVENQGDGAHAFPGTRHADWHGFDGADIVFPLFLFVVGGSLALSIERASWGRILRRTALLFFLGLVLNGLGRVPLESLKWMGVLQRIALCYLLAAVLVRLVPDRRRQVLVAGSVLVGYWLFLSAGPLTPDRSTAGWLDRLLLGQAHMYKDGLYDPSGLASTPAATVNVLAGYWAVRWVRTQPMWARAAGTLFRVGLACLAGGLAWAVVHPLNKRLWTGSFVVVTVGLSLLALAGVYLLVDVRERRRWAWVAEVFGRNAVVLYVASELVSDWAQHSGVRQWAYHHLFVPWAGLQGGSLAYSLAFVGLWWLLLYPLWRRRCFVSL